MSLLPAIGPLVEKEEDQGEEHAYSIHVDLSDGEFHILDMCCFIQIALLSIIFTVVMIYYIKRRMELG